MPKFPIEYFQLQCFPSSSRILSLSDPRIPIDHKVTLHFGDNNQPNDNRSLHFQSPMVKLEPLNTVAKYNSLERFDDGKYFLSSILSESRSHITLSFPTYWHCLASGVKQMYPHVHRVVYGLAINSIDSTTKADEINVSKLYNWIKLRLINSRFRFSGSDTYIFMVSVDFFEHLGINFEWIRFVWFGSVWMPWQTIKLIAN